MGRWWSQDFLCTNPECGIRFDFVIQHEDREKPIPCEACSSPADPVFGAPPTMERALPDGTNRGAAWDRQKEIASLKLTRKQTRPDRRADVDREIAKITRKQLGGN